MRRLLLLVLLGCPLVVAAQSAAHTIAPGMTRAQVISALGAPTTMRTASDFTYLFYRNECGRRCGMNDLVVLRRDSVVDAIFRSPKRAYSGKSSSPAPISAADAAREKPSTAGTPARMKPPAEPNDVRPSIPRNPPVVKPAPTSKPPKKAP
jgi:outer membrane protein assembly factor BamE (lipoprotein component of BamABCDE complex)